MPETTNGNTTLSLPLYKKLNVLFRVEPGCLGPDGINHIEKFCKYAALHMDASYIRWVITPRYDKSLPEIEYRIGNKLINQQRAQQYLTVLDNSMEDFEEVLQEKLAELIDEFLGR